MPVADRPDSQSDIAPRHHPKLWFSDGNIVIQAFPTHDGTSTGCQPVAYRVHRSILALHCAAFAELWENDASIMDSASKLVDGVPLMELPDDAKDLEVFLNALYFPKYASMNPTVIRIF